jgi:hypothetical protein
VKDIDDEIEFAEKHIYDINDKEEVVQDDDQRKYKLKVQSLSSKFSKVFDEYLN